MSRRCLYCYAPLENGETDFHPQCVKKFFGGNVLPALNYTVAEMDALAEQVINEQTALTGVQPKLSLHLDKHSGSKRLTIVGLWGNYICKPQTSRFQMLPEIEDLTMHLAELAKIETVPHTLMRMADNTLCYLTRRIDRSATGEKIAMEDMCQITERLTEHKYHGSYEGVGNAILKYSSAPKLDLVNYFERVWFCWLSGNNDMHLKNFSLCELDDEIRLAPAYDFLNTAIVNPKDKEELALTLNGKKKNIRYKDFFSAAESLGIGKRTLDLLVKKYIKLFPKMESLIGNSFLSDDLKTKYIALIRERLECFQ